MCLIFPQIIASLVEVQVMFEFSNSLQILGNEIELSEANL